MKAIFDFFFPNPMRMDDPTTSLQYLERMNRRALPVVEEDDDAASELEGGARKVRANLHLPGRYISDGRDIRKVL